MATCEGGRAVSGSSDRWRASPGSGTRQVYPCSGVSLPAPGLGFIFSSVNELRSSPGLSIHPHPSSLPDTQGQEAARSEGAQGPRGLSND